MALAPNLLILTGAPGSGKTAILNQLRSEFRCVDEPAREVLAEQRATGGIGTWDQDRFLFVHLLLQRSIQKYQSTLRSGRTVLFDRGIPDCVVYAVRADADPTPSLDAAEVFRYHPEVLFLEPWSAIYRTDEERIMSFDDTVAFSEALTEVYEGAGYGLVCIPRASIARSSDLRTGVHREPHGHWLNSQGLAFSRRITCNLLASHNVRYPDAIPSACAPVGVPPFGLRATLGPYSGPKPPGFSLRCHVPPIRAIPETSLKALGPTEVGGSNPLTSTRKFAPSSQGFPLAVTGCWLFLEPPRPKERP